MHSVAKRSIICTYLLDIKVCLCACVGMHLYNRIDERYPEVGHTYLPNDSNQGHIRAKSRAFPTIPDIAAWEEIAKSANRNHPNHVHMWNKELMRDWTAFLEQFYVKKLRDGVLISQYRYRNYGIGEENGIEVAHPGEVWMRKTMDGRIKGADGEWMEEPWVKVSMRKRVWPLHSLPITDISFRLYDEPLPLEPKRIICLLKHAKLLEKKYRHQYEVLAKGREEELKEVISQYEGFDGLINGIPELNADSPRIPLHEANFVEENEERPLTHD